LRIIRLKSSDFTLAFPTTKIPTFYRLSKQKVNSFINILIGEKFIGLKSGWQKKKIFIKLSFHIEAL